MSGLRGKRDKDRRGSDRPELVPNRLSIDLRPNELSILTGRKSAAPVPGQPTDRAVPADRNERQDRPQRAERSDAAPTRTRRSRSGLSIVLFLAWIALLIVPRIADFLPFGGSAPTTTTQPEPTKPAEGGIPSGSSSPTQVLVGEVAFGSVRGVDCSVAEPHDTFAVNEDIWWSAKFAVALRPDERVSWTVARDGIVLTRGIGPSDSPPGRWDVLCGDEPLSYGTLGLYEFRIVEAETDVLLAEGTFTIE